MFSWIRHYVAEVCALPSALLIKCDLIPRNNLFYKLNVWAFLLPRWPQPFWQGLYEEQTMYTFTTVIWMFQTVQQTLQEVFATPIACATTPESPGNCKRKRSQTNSVVWRTALIWSRQKRITNSCHGQGGNLPKVLANGFTHTIEQHSRWIQMSEGTNGRDVQGDNIISVHTCPWNKNEDNRASERGSRPLTGANVWRHKNGK